MGGTATRTIVAALASLLLGGACRQLNESHCGNQAGGDTCLQRDATLPYCNLCVAANDGCVAAPTFEPECGGLGSTGAEPPTSSTTAPADGSTDATSTGAVDSSSTGEVSLCGNGVIDEEAGEVCDGEALPEGTTCQTKKDFGEGVPGCSEDCSTIDYTVCPMYGLCGNGEVGFGEECDGKLFANGVMGCGDLDNYTGEGLVCTDDCTLDVSACTECREPGQPCAPDMEVCCDETQICGVVGLSGRRCCVQGLGCLP